MFIFQRKVYPSIPSKTHWSSLNVGMCWSALHMTESNFTTLGMSLTMRRAYRPCLTKWRGSSVILCYVVLREGLHICALTLWVRNVTSWGHCNGYKLLVSCWWQQYIIAVSPCVYLCECVQYCDMGGAKKQKFL